MRAVGACVQRKINRPILHDNGHETVLDLDVEASDRPICDPTIRAHPLYIGLISESHYVSLVKMEHCRDLQKETSSSVLESSGAHFNRGTELAVSVV